MTRLQVTVAGILAALLGISPVAIVPASAQVQLNVCGAPPLPPCGPRYPPPPDYGRPPPPDYYDRPGRGYEDFGRLCRTRYTRCRVPPRPLGSRCSCEDDDGEEVLGRIVR